MSQATGFTRRRFLRTAAAVGAGAFALPACAFAESTTKAGEPALCWGVIGVGHRGGIHLNAINSLPDDMQILGLCDVMESHLAAAAKKAPAGQTYSDYQKLLANPDINAVMIATPNCVHKDVVLAALSAGKHIMCEKPIAVSIDECKVMKEAAQSRPDQKILYTLQLRYSPRFITMRKAIEDGKIGKPKEMLLVESRGDWAAGAWLYDDPKLGKVNWRFSHAASGGTLNEKVCHYFDILDWMADAVPQSVSCVGGIARYTDGRDTWDNATTIVRYPNDLTATHNLCMFGPKRLELQVIGDEATLFINDDGLWLETGKKAKEPIELPSEIAHGERGPAKGQETAVLRMYDDFLDCVKNRKKPWMDADRAMTSSKTAWLGELSSDQKREVKWDELG